MSWEIQPAVVVHGGAGAWQSADEAAAEAGCLAAVDVGIAVLGAGGSAMDAAIAAVRVLEDDPIYNAGIGSVLTVDGRVEVDAAVMDGATLGFGAIAAVDGAYPGVDIARAVLDDCPHVLLSGEGAAEFARQRGFAWTNLVTERAQKRLERDLSGRGDATPGTVGAAAIDASGDVAAATSTGGTSGKMRGRIGDTPVCGAGTYADNEGGAASATGLGEAIIRVTLSRQVIDRMRDGMSASQAAWAAVATLERGGGTGGLVCCDRDGRLGAAHTTPRMPYAGARLDAEGNRHRAAGVMAEEGFDVWSAIN